MSRGMEVGQLFYVIYFCRKMFKYLKD